MDSWNWKRKEESRPKSKKKEIIEGGGGKGWFGGNRRKRKKEDKWGFTLYCNAADQGGFTIRQKYNFLPLKWSVYISHLFTTACTVLA